MGLFFERLGVAALVAVRRRRDSISGARIKIVAEGAA